MSAFHSLLAVLMSIVFGAGWIFGKVALEHFPPILLAGFRFGVAGLLGLLFFRPLPVKLPYLILISALAISIPYSLSNYALSKLDVSVTVFLVQLEAPILIIMSIFIAKEYPNWTVMAGIGLALFGVVLVAGRPVVDGNHIAVALAMASMIVWAMGQLLIRKLGVEATFSLLGALSLLAAPQLIVFSIIFQEDQLTAIREASIGNWVQVIYLGAFMTTLGIGIWYFLISRHPMKTVAPFLLLVPVVSLLGGVFLLGEELELLTAIGGTVILAGVALATFQNFNRSNSMDLKNADEYS